jgi:hypothetical protein
MPETANQQSGAGDEHDGERDFDGDERRAQRSLSRPPAALRRSSA